MVALLAWRIIWHVCIHLFFYETWLILTQPCIIKTFTTNNKKMRFWNKKKSSCVFAQTCRVCVRWAFQISGQLPWATPRGKTEFVSTKANYLHSKSQRHTVDIEYFGRPPALDYVINIIRFCSIYFNGRHILLQYIQGLGQCGTPEGEGESRSGCDKLWQRLLC